VLFDERIVYSQCLTADSNINMYGNYKKSIADIVIGDAVQAFDEGGFEKTIATVTDKSSFMPEKLYEVELEDGSKFYATPDHRVVANGKWVYIEDMLHDVSAYDILEL
jgi:intein/homing endonuclease